jgi:hypothetical protein
MRPTRLRIRGRSDGARRAGSRPNTSTRPLDGRTWKLKRSKVRDLPLPDGPTRNKRELGPTAKVTLDSQDGESVDDRSTSSTRATSCWGEDAWVGARFLDIELKISDLDCDPPERKSR